MPPIICSKAPSLGRAVPSGQVGGGLACGGRPSGPGRPRTPARRPAAAFQGRRELGLGLGELVLPGVHVAAHGHGRGADVRLGAGLIASLRASGYCPARASACSRFRSMLGSLIRPGARRGSPRRDWGLCAAATSRPRPRRSWPRAGRS